MAQPLMAEAQHARDLIIALGRLLDDTAAGRTADEVHRLLLQEFDSPRHDSRIDGVEVGRQEFARLWQTLRSGSAMPVTAWEQVVLPTVIALGGPQNQKIQLELATARWLAARAAVDAVPDYPNVIAAAPTARPSATAAVPPPATAPLRAAANDVTGGLPAVEERPRPRRALRVLLPMVLLAAAVLAAFALLGGKAPERPGLPASMAGSTPTPRGSAAVVIAGPSAQPSPLPTAMPSATSQPQPAITTLPAPSPVWSGPGPSTPPAAPTGLTAVAATEDSVMLTWSAPLDGGTGGTSYYRILRDGQPSGWTRETSATVTGLMPGTMYAFTIVALNGAGQQSAPSSAVIVVTASPPPSPSAEPPSPSPEESTAPSEPSPEPPASPEPSPQEPSPSPSPDEPAGEDLT